MISKQPALARLGAWLLAGLAAVALGLPARAAGAAGTRFTHTERESLQREARLVVDLLQNHHYSGRAFREIDNREMIERFLAELDPQGDLFTGEDRRFFQQRFGRTFKTVYLFRGDLQPAFEIFDAFAARVRDRLTWVTGRLDRGLDLTASESLHRPRRPTTPDPEAATDGHWEKELKLAVIREILRGRSFNEAHDEVAKHYARFGRWAATADSVAIREHFFDAVIRSFDPHSGYSSADSAQDFSTTMEGAVSGIGLDLGTRNGDCIVEGVQPGGPADLESGIARGDRLVALAEGDGAWVEVSGMRLRHIIGHLRGEPGTKVRLAYRPTETETRREATLTRARVVNPDDRARGGLSEVPDGSGRIRRVGWIELPAFYSGGSGADEASASRDVGALLREMLAAGAEALVLDLRNNPGGALNEASAVSGLFLPGGVVAHTRGLDGVVQSVAAPDSPPAYAGPLVVLVSPRSASASEVFTGAMRLHRRAIVVGGESTFGKGTVQTYVDLPKLPGTAATVSKDWGLLRLTTAQYYLPDGSPVQQTGVPSDIVLPFLPWPDMQLEFELPHALPAERLSPANLKPPFSAATSTVDPALCDRLRKLADSNLATLPEWDVWRKEQEIAHAALNREDFDLCLETRRTEHGEHLARLHRLHATRRELAVTRTYQTREFDLPAVAAARAAHESKLQTLLRGDVRPPLLHRSAIVVQTAGGKLQSLAVDEVAAAPCPGDAEVLAPALTAILARPVTGETVLRAWQEIALLEYGADDAVLAAAKRAVRDDVPPELLGAFTAHLLGAIADLQLRDGRGQPAFDVPRREALRLAADWCAEAPAKH